MKFFPTFSKAASSAREVLREAIEYIAMHAGGFGRAPRGGNGRLPGSSRNWEMEAGNVWDNSAVSILLRWFCNTFCEAPLIVKQSQADGTWQEMPLHDVALIVKRPNRHFTRTQLFKAILLSYFADGNAYLYKGRSRANKVVQLWWMPHWLMEPRASDDPSEWMDGGDEFVSYFEYKVNNKIKRYAPADIIHFKEGVDPENYRKGLSPLKALFREICTDNQILTYTYGILKNAGVPPYTLSPDFAKGEVDIDEEFSKKIKKRWRDATTGDNAGDVMVLTSPWKVEKLGFSPKDLDITSIGAMAEARLAGAFNLPAVTVQLLVGLKEANAKASHKESKLQAYESGIMPVQRDFCETLDLHLIPELGDELRECCHFDTREIAALKENQNEIAKRADDGFKANVVTLNEARAARGLPDDEEMDGYAHQILPAPGGMLAALMGSTPEGEESGEAQAGSLATNPLNGIQIQAALDVIERLQLGQITEMIAVELLVAVGIERTRAEEMATSAKEADAPDPVIVPVESTPVEEAGKAARRAITKFWRVAKTKPAS